MAKLKFIDKREETVPTFSDLNIGDLFTSVGEEFPFIKIAVMYNDIREIINNSQLITIKDLQKRKLSEKVSASWSKFIAIFK